MTTFLDAALHAAGIRAHTARTDESKRAILLSVCRERAERSGGLSLARELADGVRGLRLAVENAAMQRAARPKPRRRGLLAAVDRINARNGHRPEKVS